MCPDGPDPSDQKRQLEEIQLLLRQNREQIKPLFGFMFWQLHESERALTADQFAEQGMNFRLSDDDDEVTAAFIAAYVKLWHSANDFNAASRFLAAKLGLTVDELLQSREVFLRHAGG